MCSFIYTKTSNISSLDIRTGLVLGDPDLWMDTPAGALVKGGSMFLDPPVPEMLTPAIDVFL